MIKVIGVRFRPAGKIYFFEPADLEIKKGDHVIVETARGIEFGTVVSGIRQVTDDEIIQPLKPVLRIATERDICQEADNKRREKQAFKICLEKIREHNLEMKLIDAEYTFDNNKVLFYFTSEGRIDFRELVKDLAAIFRTRIELRQIGVRDETKLVGGIGMCGRPLCCHTHLSDFVTVSIKMAKEQNLSLNPTKISGVCDRLMCCLKHEEETYEELNKKLPHIGDRVICPDELQGEVTDVNVLRQLVKVIVEKGDSREVCEYKAEDIRFVRKGYRQAKDEVSAEELQALELMEKKDKMDNKESEEKPVQRKERRNREERADRREERIERREEQRAESREEREECVDEYHTENHEEIRREERKNKKYREEREPRKERREYFNRENPHKPSFQDAEDSFQERKPRFDKKRKFEKGKEKPFEKENMNSAFVEEKEEGERAERYRKKPYSNRNRKRSRFEGEREHEES